MADEKFALKFLVEAMQKMPIIPAALDFGCGPTVHHLFPLVPKVQEMHMAEYLAGLWKETRFRRTWRPMRANRRHARALPASFLTDAGRPHPLGPERRGFYDLVTTRYCAEGATRPGLLIERAK